MDRTQSHSDPNEKSLPAQSPDVVLNGVFEDRQGRWMQGGTSLGFDFRDWSLGFRV